MIGRVLSKYKILEEVGQGGMSVVYKGLDMSLNREVAIKVLHPHLAAQDEAKQRFQREAHAVAKLRHENILEIYDYSGRGSADSYIVTELIQGRTLRQIVNEHAPAFPEIAAMIVLEVSRALAHAHSLGVLHRDVKPENIMIRDDGMLKLMDFGIAQIVDSQRMTVTGQLLGSPAYMSPEHIEGRPLDFRTDIFSAGILLYQLSTGELPFKGRNPHEILKRIAECRFLDARVVNPLVSDRLNRIITRALARDPDDRYPDVNLLLDDLQRFLAEVELTEPRNELRAFFARSVPYEQALRQRLIAALTKRGRAELDSKHAACALELWNRVLTIDPANEEVLRLIDRLSRRRRFSWGLGVGLALLTVSGGLAAANVVLGRRAAARPVALPDEPLPVALAPPAAFEPAPSVGPRSTLAVAGAPDAQPAVAAVDVEPPAAPDEGPAVPRTLTRHPAPRRPEVPRHLDGLIRTPPPQPPAASRLFRLVPSPKNATYSVDAGPFVQVENGGVDLNLGPGGHKIVVKNPLCEDFVEKIDAAEPGRPITAKMPFKPTQVVVRCKEASAIVINDRAVVNGTAVEIDKFHQGSKELVTVEFMIGGQTHTKTVLVSAAAPRTEVTCEAP